QPSALPPSALTCSHVSDPTALFSEMSSRTPSATVATRVEFTSAALWMLRPTTLTTQTELFDAPEIGRWVTTTLPDDAVVPPDEGWTAPAAAASRPSPRSTNRIIRVTSPSYCARLPPGERTG